MVIIITLVVAVFSVTNLGLFNEKVKNFCHFKNILFLGEMCQKSLMRVKVGNTVSIASYNILYGPVSVGSVPIRLDLCMVLGCKGEKKEDHRYKWAFECRRFVVQGPHLFESGTGTCFED